MDKLHNYDSPYLFSPVTPTYRYGGNGVFSGSAACSDATQYPAMPHSSTQSHQGLHGLLVCGGRFAQSVRSLHPVEYIDHPPTLRNG
jgi:hypothetical protein